MINKAAEIEAAYGRDTFARGLFGLNADKRSGNTLLTRVGGNPNRQIR